MPLSVDIHTVRNNKYIAGTCHLCNGVVSGIINQAETYEHPIGNLPYDDGRKRGMQEFEAELNENMRLKIKYMKGEIE